MLFKGIFCISLFFAGSLSAQNPVVEDIKQSLSEKPGFDAKFETRNSFIAAKHAGIISIRTGLNFNEIVKLGLGYNFLFTTIHSDRLITNSIGDRERVNSRFRMQYINIYGEYMFYDQNRLELSFHALAGAGVSRFEYTDRFDVADRTRNRFVLIYEPYMSGDYRLFKYVGIGAGLGYRLVYSPEHFSRTRLNSPIYIVKLKIYFQDLYNALR